MIHSVPELKVTQALAERLAKADTERLITDKKLVLLVDLDQTLIHTTNDNIPNNLKDVYHFQLYPNSPWYHTRLRPGALQFLANMHPFYELHICTFGARNYAHTIAQFLDEDGHFFSQRILSRDECVNLTSKRDNLKALFPCGDAMVCIIDDREDVWNMASNLIQVKPYHFFQHTGDINAPPGMAKHELDGEGVDIERVVVQETLKREGRKHKRRLSELSSKSSKSDADSSSRSEDEFKDKLPLHEPISENSNDSSSKENDETVAPIIPEIIKKEAAPVLKPETNEEPETSPKTPDDNKIETSESPPDITTTKLDETKKAEDKQKKECTDEAKPGDGKEQKADKKAEKNDKDSSDEDNLIEVDDPDDFLLYLETILKKIHKIFYEQYQAEGKLPDLKLLIPQLRSKVLVGKKIVFSGLVPNQIPLENSKAYQVATGLGAEVFSEIKDDTTHLVAACLGTNKVNQAKKISTIEVVRPEWLWTCAERWEIVEEKLFPVSKVPSRMREPPPHCSPEHRPEMIEPKFMDTINPLLSFSNADLDEMDKDFNQFFESDSSSSDNDQPRDIENPPMDKNLRKRKREEEDAIKPNFFTRPEAKKISLSSADPEDESGSSTSLSNSDDDEMPSEKFRRGEGLPSDLDCESESSKGSEEPIDDVDDGEWNMMGAALEREFLGLDDD